MSKCSYCGYELKVGQAVCPACKSVVIAKEKKADKEDIVIAKPSVFLKYADLLDNDALFQAAVCKLNGISVAQDKAEAFEMFKILAFRGHHEAMYKLAELLLESNLPDEESAIRWLKIAAAEGHKASKLKLKMLDPDYKEDKSESQSIQNISSGLEALVRDALPSIVSINAGYKEDGNKMRSAGSGFIIEGGYVVTNAHVVGDDPIYITANFEPDIDKVTYNLLPVAVAQELDIAVLKFTGLAEKKIISRPNLNLRFNDIAYGEDVYTIGNPLGIGLSVAKGVVSCPNRKSDYPPAVKEVIQTDMTINHGNSGGALLDMDNNVLGMITFSISISEGGIAMCVPASYIVKLLNKINKD